MCKYVTRRMVWEVGELRNAEDKMKGSRLCLKSLETPIYCANRHKAIITVRINSLFS